MLLDAPRNKIMLHATVSIALFGDIQTDVLFDFNNNISYTYTPFISLCQTTNLSGFLNLTDFLTKAYTPALNVTTYVGPSALPWAANKANLTDFKFASLELLGSYPLQLDSYFRKELSSDGGLPGTADWLVYQEQGAAANFGPSGLVNSTF